MNNQLNDRFNQNLCPCGDAITTAGRALSARMAEGLRAGGWPDYPRCATCARMVARSLTNHRRRGKAAGLGNRD